MLCLMSSTHVADIDLNLLVALQHLFETGSVTGAARAMGLTQPAMSRVLGRLRATFSDPLFVRTPQGLAPTPRAEGLKPLLTEALARVDAVISGPTRFDPRTSTRQFTIATADYGLTVLMPRLLAALRQEAPRVSVRFVTKAGDWERALTTGDWDLCWTVRRQDVGSRAIVWNRLVSEDFTVVVRRGHAAARGRFTLERFLQLEQISISPEGRPGNHVDETLARLGQSRRVVALVPSFLVVPALISASNLAAVLPRRIVAATAAANGLAALDVPFALTGFDFSQGWHERMRHDDGHAWFRQRLRTLAATL